MKFRFAFFIILSVILVRDAVSSGPNTFGSVLQKRKDLSIFADLLDYSHISWTVSSAQDVTVLAPKNSAFKTTAKFIGCTSTSTEKSIVACFKSQGRKRVRGLLRTHLLVSMYQTPKQYPSLGEPLKPLHKTASEKSFASWHGGASHSRFTGLTGKDDLLFENGIVHVIDQVILSAQRVEPVAPQKLSDVLHETGKFSILLTILNQTGTLTTLELGLNQTVFAPTDYAFRMSAREIGCSKFENDEDIVACFTGALPSDFGPVPFEWKYHVLHDVYYLSEMLYSHVFEMSNGIQVYRKGIFFVDQVPWLQNARLKVDLYDIPYDGGVIHSIHRVMLPFTSASPTDPCQLYEYPFAVADGTFVAIYRLTKAVSKCDLVRNAIHACDVDEIDECMSRQGTRVLAEGITAGQAVTSAKKCTPVFDALKTCAWYKPTL